MSINILSTSYILTLTATSGATADGSDSNTLTVALINSGSYVDNAEIDLSVISGTAVFSSGLSHITVTTNTLGVATASLTDTVEETVTVKATLLSDTTVTGQATSTFGDGGGGSSYPAPSVTESVNGILPYTVTEAHVTVSTATLNIGDTVELIWSGTLADGSAAGDYTAYDTVSSVTENLTFIIPSTHITLLAGGSVNVSYTDVATGEDSDSLHLSVSSSDSSWLDAPEVEEASGSTLSSSVSQATVDIPPWNGMAAGDIVSLNWDGNVTGTYLLTHTVSGNTTGKTLTFTVPVSEIKGNETVGLNYTVEPASGGSTLISWPLGLNVI